MIVDGLHDFLRVVHVGHALSYSFYMRSRKRLTETLWTGWTGCTGQRRGSGEVEEGRDAEYFGVWRLPES
jgi:hypothetical protein